MNFNSFSKINTSQEFYEPPMFWNFTLDKGRLKNFVCWFLKTYGEKKTLEFLEELKILGFGYATRAGISLGIEDLKIPPAKSKLLAEAELALAESALSYKRGEITGIEKMQRFIETWNETSETLKQEVVRYFEKTDTLNPVYMMAFSGARGNLSQVRQLVGMRGLMSDPQGKIIDFPIQSNFREGLTLTEYLISTYGARKGIVDTALRTATAGYLTRRLVDVAQHVIVSKFDCGTQRGIFLFDMKEGVKTIYSFPTRLTGRVLAQDILEPLNLDSTFNQKPSYIAYRNQEITSELAEAISKVTKKALVRSPLTCETRKLVCQLCYGWSLATSRLVSIGETVGVIAGQSIGEPGTQLTMRTFHTGGVFSANVTQQINAPFSGIVEYAHPIAGTCIRLPNGTLGFLTKTNGTLFLKKYNHDSNKNSNKMKVEPEVLQESSFKEQKTTLNLEPVLTNTYKIPAFTILFARHGQSLKINSIVAQISALPTGQKLTQTIEQTIYSSLEGEVYYSNIDILEDIDEKYGERISKAEDWSKVWVLAAKISKNNFVSPFFSKVGDYISKSSMVNEIKWVTPNPQPSFFNLKIDSGAKLNSREYSLNLKNQITRFQNLKRDPTSFSKAGKEKSLELSAETLTGQLTLKPTVQISSKYQIKKKFLTNHPFVPLNCLQVNNLLKRNDPVLTRIQTNNLNKDLLQVQTEFNYPFHSSSRFSLSTILKQTFISFPVLRPGILSSWLKSERNVYQKRPTRHMKFTEQKGLHLFVKRLNMNPRFRMYQFTKANFFQPFILGNLIPFTLKQKTIQQWLKGRLNQNVRETQISTVLELEKQKLNKQFFLSTGFSGKLDQTLNDQNLYKQLILKQKNKNSFSLNQTKNKLLKSSLKKETNFKPKVFSSHKFQKLAMQTPMLVLPTKKVQYRKLGYFASIVLDSNQTDQFFSSLPLQLDGTIPSSLKSLVQHNAKKTNFQNFHQNIQYSQNLNRKNLEGLKNSYQWGPYPSSGFYWLPQTSQISTNGLFLIHSPLRTEKIFQQFLFKFTSKLFKTSPFDPEKYATFLNFAQSQSFKKSNRSKNSLDLKKNSILTVDHSIFKNNPNQKFHDNDNIVAKKIPSYFFKNTMKFSSFKENSHAYLSKRLFQVNTETLKLSTNSNFLNFQKSSLTTSIYETSEDLKKWNEVQISLFGKKENMSLKPRKHFQVKLNLSEKNSVFFDEIYWLPQENYTLDCYNSKEFHTKLQDYKFSFIPKQKKNMLNNPVQFYLTNAQGLKKEFYFKNEGLLKLTKVNKVKSLSLKNNSFNTKKYSSFLNQNFMFRQNLNSTEWETQINQENKLKLNFLNYLQSSKFLNKKRNDHKKNNSIMQKKSKENNFMAKKTVHSLFNFVPFLPKNELTMHHEILRKKINEFNTRYEKFVTSTTESSIVPSVNNNSALKAIFTDTYGRVSHPKLDSTELNLTLKPGWIYKTTNFLQVLQCHKTLIEKGKLVLDDISFEQQKVFVEIIHPKENLNTKTSVDGSQNLDKGPKELKFKKNSWDKDFQMFKISKVIENPTPRFFKNPSREELKSKKTNQTKNKTQKIEHSNFSILIRPFYHQILPSNLQMKTKLYKSMKKNEQTQFDTSYALYKDYFLPNLNCQETPGKTVSSFPPMDLKIEKLDGFPFNQFLEKKSQTTFSLNKQKYGSMSKRKSKRYHPKTKVFSWKYCFDFLFKKSKLTTFSEKSQQKIYSFGLGTRYSKNVKNTQILKNNQSNLFDNSFYMSNYPIQLSSYKVSLEPAFENRLSPKLPKIALKLNTFENSLFKDFSKTKINQAVQLKYLSLLLLRSNYKQLNLESLETTFFQTNIEKVVNPSPSNNGVVLSLALKDNQRNVVKKSVMKRFSFNPVFEETQKPYNLETKKTKGMGSIFLNSSSIKSFLRSFVHLNFFEYSYEEQYDFFANQRLFASSFYKQQFKNSLRLNGLNKDTISTESVRSKRFIQNYLNKNVFADSRYELNNSKNQMVFQNQTLRGNKILGVTSFYSPYEGEVLKDYASETDLNTLKKSFNVNLDNVHLLQTQSQQLILTKSDLFSLNLFNLGNLKNDRRTFLENQAENKIDKRLNTNEAFFNNKLTRDFFEKLVQYHQSFQKLEKTYFDELDLNKYEISEFETQYQNKHYRLKKLNLGLSQKLEKLRLGTLMSTGDSLYTNKRVTQSGQIVHLSAEKLTLRKAEFFSVSPKTILHSYNGHSITKNMAVMTLPFETLKTGDIVQGIPKVEQYLEARTTIQGRLFLNSLPVLLYAIYQRYASKLKMEKAVRQSFLKIQQILVDGIQRVYRSQGVGIADKHLEIIVRQMTSKVKIVHGGQTGFFAGEIVDLEFVERINSFLMIKIRYEPIVLGITRASLEVDSFLSAASFQQTTKVLTRAAIENKKDFLKGLKENLLVGNLLPAGTGYVLPKVH